MKKNTCLFLPLLLLLPSTSFAPNRKRKVIKKIRQLLLYVSQSNSKNQQTLITLLKNQLHLTDQPLPPTVYSSLQKNTLDFLTQHSQTIDFASANFANIPGFNNLICRIIVNHDKAEVKGILYELEKAVEIARSPNNERIIAFDEIKKSSTATREFDLITNHRWIECKNITWNTKTPKQKNQFLDQKGILEKHNRKKTTKLNYLVCSKTVIKETWKTWFTNKGISFCEDKHDQ